ncbi:TetR/AcrR family transcriptional regulator [Nocardia aurantiaca]|uniref:TetR family transcriptional regulator n=1 Tax=Nocardia aurantiaca TaxID=2675850 RepID=A0A6I3L4B3_9NOCA|nr:TetR/AcrR family transcriptional regulator [Nocardia aurantiaca]MTE15316.1 TetR family transcriptional regulator [Nocardia aurantiaca]
MPAPTTLELLWGSPDRPRRGPKPSLTLERIVGEAIDLADTEGLANLSMARLAERLGCAKMALYRYIPGKAELTALMLDTALGLPPEPPCGPTDSDPEPWRTYLRPWTETFYERAVSHPWANELTTGIRLLGPNELAWLESALAVLDGTGLTAAERLDTVVLLANHVRGMGLQAAAAGADLEGELARELGTVLTMQAQRYPHAAAAFAETMSGTAAQTGRDNALSFGIDRILDGVAALIATRR